MYGKERVRTSACVHAWVSRSVRESMSGSAELRWVSHSARTVTRAKGSLGMYSQIWARAAASRRTRCNKVFAYARDEMHTYINITHVRRTYSGELGAGEVIVSSGEVGLDTGEPGPTSTQTMQALCTCSSKRPKSGDDAWNTIVW